MHEPDGRLAQLYGRRSGRGGECYAALMAENNGGGRWLSAEEAVSAGLADRIFDGLMTGVILPEGTPLPPQKGDGAAGGEDTSSQQGGDTAQSETIPSARAEKPDKDATCEVVEKAAAAVAGDVVKGAVRRFAHCWDKFMERVRSRPEARRAARDGGGAEDAAGEPGAAKAGAAQGGGGEKPSRQGQFFGMCGGAVVHENAKKFFGRLRLYKAAGRGQLPRLGEVDDDVFVQGDEFLGESERVYKR